MSTTAVIPAGAGLPLAPSKWRGKPTAEVESEKSGRILGEERESSRGSVGEFSEKCEGLLGEV